MGWLKELLKGEGRRGSSLGSLARAALAHPEWPGSERIQARSLAAILSKLDRGIELSWLADRPVVQSILAEIVDRPLADVRAPLEQRGLSGEPHARRVKLADVRDARLLDPFQDAFCPAIPETLIHPGRFHRLLWPAPPGSGLELVKAWLSATESATLITLDNDTSSLADSDGVTPLFIEVGPGTSGAALRGWPENPICVAYPSAAAPPGAFAEFRVVRSPLLSECLEPLVDWVLSFLPPDTKLDRTRLVRHVRSLLASPSEARWLDGCEALMGFMGALDELGVSDPVDYTIEELSRAFVRQRVSEAPGDAPAAAWLRRAGMDVLLSLMRRQLTDAERPWESRRSFDAWLELVPEEYRYGTDPEWMELSLKRADQTLRRSDVKKVIEKLPPGAFRVLRGLQAAELLSETKNAELVLRPRWLLNALRERALENVLDASALEWGEALLRPESAPLVLRGLLGRSLTDDGPAIDQVLELESEHGMAYVAALEAVFRATGLALLSGSELAADQLEALFLEQLDHVVDLGDGIPRPKLDLDDWSYFDVFGVERATRAFAELGTWYLAALSISEHLPAAIRVRHKALSPWRETQVPEQLGYIYDRILEVVTASDVPWTNAAFSLVDRLRQNIGGALASGKPHPLELPSIVLDEIAHDLLSWETLEACSAHGAIVFALKELAAARAMAWPAVAEACWNAFFAARGDASEPAKGSAWASTPLDPESSHAELFWPFLPVSALSKLLCPPWVGELAYQHFTPDQWSAFIQLLPPAELERAGAAWRVIPEPSCAELLDSGRLVPEAVSVYRVLWSRFPELLLRAHWARSSTDPLGALSILLTAPGDQTEALLEQLGRARLLDLPPAVLEAVRGWLYERIARRSPGFRAAFGLFSDLSLALEPFAPR